MQKRSGITLTFTPCSNPTHTKRGLTSGRVATPGLSPWTCVSRRRTTPSGDCRENRAYRVRVERRAGSAIGLDSRSVVQPWQLPLNRVYITMHRGDRGIFRENLANLAPPTFSPIWLLVVGGVFLWLKFFHSPNVGRGVATPVWVKLYADSGFGFGLPSSHVK